MSLFKFFFKSSQKHIGLSDKELQHYYKNEDKCYAYIATQLIFHKNRLIDKAIKEAKFYAKVPGADMLLHVSTRPTAKEQCDISAILVNLLRIDKRTTTQEKITHFIPVWNATKHRLIASSELDMPFSDAAKYGERLVSRIDKMIEKIQSLRNPAAPAQISKSR